MKSFIKYIFSDKGEAKIALTIGIVYILIVAIKLVGLMFC
jgi:hypothetical protein